MLQRQKHFTVKPDESQLEKGKRKLELTLVSALLLFGVAGRFNY